jgi:hypothetical protein
MAMLYVPARQQAAKMNRKIWGEADFKAQGCQNC